MPHFGPYAEPTARPLGQNQRGVRERVDGTRLITSDAQFARTRLVAPAVPARQPGLADQFHRLATSQLPLDLPGAGAVLVPFGLLMVLLGGIELLLSRL